MKLLFNTSCDFNQDVYRNIVSPRQPIDPFDDLTQGDTQLSVLASAVAANVKHDTAVDIISRDFHYLTAISYPFDTQPYMASRYSDGSFGVWYGALEVATSIAETTYHMLRTESGIEGVDEIIIRERAVYQVHCNAVMIDLINKRRSHAELTADDHTFTQWIGRRLKYEGHPGLLAPSARCEGSNSVVFNSAVLSNPRVIHYMTYIYDASQKTVTVKNE